MLTKRATGVDQILRSLKGCVIVIRSELWRLMTAQTLQKMILAIFCGSKYTVFCLTNHFETDYVDQKVNRC